MHAASLIFLDLFTILKLCAFLYMLYDRDQGVQKPFDAAMAVAEKSQRIGETAI
jgi:hypothetical protein